MDIGHKRALSSPAQNRAHTDQTLQGALRAADRIGRMRRSGTRPVAASRRVPQTNERLFPEHQPEEMKMADDYVWLCFINIRFDECVLSAARPIVRPVGLSYVLARDLD